MSEINQEVGTNQEQVLKKLQSCFAGKIVRKDLTKKIKEGANVPVYVLEYLLGMLLSVKLKAPPSGILF